MLRSIDCSRSTDRSRPRRRRAIAALLVLPVLLAACGGTTEVADEAPAEAAEVPAEAAADAEGALVVYSGRSEELVGPILAEFTAATGIALEVRYGDTAELAAAILAEGEASPADVFFGQDAGALGALEAAGRFAELSGDVLEPIEPTYRSAEGRWVGITGRARVIVHSPELAEDELPDSVTELTDPVWRGRIGWAPTNASFQAFVTALRLIEGEDAARAWLEGMLANDVQVYERNTAIVEAVARGEIDLGLTNHYYLLRYLAEDPDFAAVNRFLPGDVGGLVNVAGVGVLSSSERPAGAAELVAFLLSEDVQRTFAEAVATEYPLRAGIEPSATLPTLAELSPPALDLGRLEDLEGTLTLLREVGVLD